MDLPRRVVAMGLWVMCLVNFACGAPDTTDTGPERLGRTAQSFAEFDPVGTAAVYSAANQVCYPTQLSWSAQSLPHNIGRADADGWSANTVQDSAGFLQYGPYTTQVFPGAHTAVWNLMIDNNTANNDTIVRLEAYDASTNTVLAFREVRRMEWTASFQYQPFTVPFTLDSSRLSHRLEFRLFWYGRAYVREQSVSVDPSCLPTQQRWSAQSLPHNIGRAEADGWSANMAQDSAGFLQYGPYTTKVSEGRHVALWNLMIDNNSANNDAIVRIEAYDAKSNTVLASREITRMDWTATFQYQTFALPFIANSPQTGHLFEFRVFWYGRAYVREQSVNLD
jgi:hypothetical protein